MAAVETTLAATAAIARAVWPRPTAPEAADPRRVVSALWRRSCQHSICRALLDVRRARWHPRSRPVFDLRHRTAPRRPGLLVGVAGIGPAARAIAVSRDGGGVGGAYHQIRSPHRVQQHVGRVPGSPASRRRGVAFRKHRRARGVRGGPVGETAGGVSGPRPGPRASDARTRRKAGLTRRCCNEQKPRIPRSRLPKHSRFLCIGKQSTCFDDRTNFTELC